MCADMAGPGGPELSCRYRRRCTLSWFDRSQQVHRQVTPLDMTLAVRQSVPLYRPVRRQAGRCLGIFAALLVAAAAVACSSAIPTPEPPAAEPTVASVSHPGACSRRNSGRNAPCGHSHGCAHSCPEAHSGDDSPHTAADNTLEFVQPELLDGAAAVARALLQSPEFAEAVTAR